MNSSARLFIGFSLLSALLFLRPASSNFIFDEQEAILKNPFLRSDAPLWDAFTVDFWGRDPAHTIGSYRPLPNLLWKALALAFGLQTPLVFAGLNLCAHAVCGVVLAHIVKCILILEAPWSSPRAVAAWGNSTGLLFIVHGLVTEAVCSLVGLADILAALFTIAAVDLIVRGATSVSRGWRVRWLLLPLAVGACVVLGLFCKETVAGSALALPLLASTLFEPRRGRGVTARVGSALSYGGVVGLLVLFAFIAYVEARKWGFPAEALDRSSPVYSAVRSHHWSWLIDWLALPPLPNDPLNNPLIGAPTSLRWPTAAALFMRQSAQMLVPWPLCSDYSFPSEVPRGWGVAPGLGASLVLIMVGSLFLLLMRGGPWVVSASGRARRRVGERLSLVGIVVWVCSYLPVSNTLVLLPTIRGERLLYLPLMGFVLAGCGASIMLVEWGRRRIVGWRQRRRVLPWVLVTYSGVIASSASVHATSYRDDLSFWSAASRAKKPSAKSHLNLGIMLGARGDLDARLLWNQRALQLAPDWAMANVYLGDVWCRKGDLEKARSPYLSGLRRAVNSKELTALALQCIWESGAYPAYRSALGALVTDGTNTWLSYFLYELDENGERNGGLPLRYRPLGYNRAPTAGE